LLERLLGQSLPAEIIAVGIALIVAAFVYAKLVLVMRVPEARQIEDLVMGRLRARR
jgi:hypothetical protein